MPANAHARIAKIEALPQDRLAEIEDFIDFILHREQERAISRAASTAQLRFRLEQPRG